MSAFTRTREDTAGVAAEAVGACIADAGVEHVRRVLDELEHQPSVYEILCIRHDWDPLAERDAEIRVWARRSIARLTP